MSNVEIIGIVYSTINISILCFTAYYIRHAPVNAVSIGRQLNLEQQKDNAKRNLFLTLFALRGSPLHYDFVKGLNQIDIVFEGNQQVRAAWHKHYNDLHNRGLVDTENIWKIGRVEVLSQMAQSLGYSSLKASDILENYYPEGHQYQEQNYFEDNQRYQNYLASSIDMNNLAIASMKAQMQLAADNKAING